MKIILIFLALLLIYVSANAEGQCSKVGSNIVISNPLEWALDCFGKYNHYKNMPSDLILGTIDINNDETKELFIGSRKSHGNASGSFYVFKLNEKYQYLGEINLDLSSIRVVRGSKEPRLFYYHHMSVETGQIITYEYKNNEFGFISSEPVSLIKDKKRFCSLWEWASQ